MYQFLEKQFFPECAKQNVEYIIINGDVFDNRKNLNIYILNQFIDRFMGLVRTYRIPVIIIPGNHDTFFKNRNDVNSLKFIDSEYICVVDKPVEVSFDGLNTLLVPWINSTNYDEFVGEIKQSKADWVFGHFEIVGMKMYKSSTCDHGMDADLFKGFDRVISGHFHHRNTVGNITYIGAAGYYDWQDYNDERGYAIIDTSTRHIAYFNNEYCLFERIHYDDTVCDYRTLDLTPLTGKLVQLVVVKKTDEGMFTDLLAKIKDTDTVDFKIIDETIKELNEVDNEKVDMTESTLDIIGLYLDEADLVGVESAGVMDLAREVYREVSVTL